MKRKLIILALALITLAGFTIRVWNITTNPPELFSDEISGYISAKSIIETGKDINGKIGLYFYNRLELYPPVYGYLAYFSSIFFKNTILAIRLPAVVSGTLAIIAIYYLSEVLFKNWMISVFTAFFYAFIPWSVHFSRIGWSPALLVLSLTVPIILFKLFIDHKKSIYFYSSCIFFAISIYTYRALELLAPLFLIILIFLFRKQLKKYFKMIFLGFIIFTILAIPCINTSVKEPLMNERADRISTFSDGVNSKSIKIFAENYIAHFNPQFLFITGDPNLRQNAGTGELYWIMLPLILIGIYTAFRNISKPEYALISLWLFIYPLGGSLTNDGVPHATRTLIGAPLFAILTAIGVYIVHSKLPKISNILTIFIVVVFLLEFFNFLPTYFRNYPIASQSWWEYGQGQVFSAIKKNTSGNESLCLLNTEYWHEETLTKYYLGINNNYKITYDPNGPGCLTSQVLVLNPQTIPPQEYTSFKTIYSLDGNPIWRIYYLSKK